MHGRLENELRFRQHREPVDLIIGHKQLVSAAMRRVREGEITPEERQVVALNFENRAFYRITDKSVFVVQDAPISTGSLSSGLRIEGILIDEPHEHVKKLRTIDIPRSWGAVDNFTLFKYLGTNLFDLARLTNEISRATKINEDVFKSLRERLH